jgi:hypothetical protein
MNQNVADILEDKTRNTITAWFHRVNLEPRLTRVSLTEAERCAHLPAVFRDLITRLRNPLPSGTPALLCEAASGYGQLRRKQGYTAAMLVEESRILEVSIFNMLGMNCAQVEAKEVMSAVMAIADEVDSQLAQSVTSYIVQANADGGPMNA